MKLNPPDVAATTPCRSAGWFSAIFSAAFLTIISLSAAVPPTGGQGLKPVEQWVAGQAEAGEVADLSKQFRNKEDRQLSADFLETLLTGTRSDVRTHRHGVQIKGACIDEPIDLKNGELPGDVLLEYFQFNRSVTFAVANFAANASFQGSTFNEGANFNHVKVGGDATFNDAVFQGPVSFFGADIAANFVAQAKFQNKKAFVNFARMKVGGDAFFNGAVFQGVVSFFATDVALRFSMQRAKFQNEGGAFFGHMKVRSDAFFDASFEGRVSFAGTDIGGNCQVVEAAGAKFQKGASFDGMKVGGTFLIEGMFECPLSFAAMDIAGDINTGAGYVNKPGFRNKALTSFYRMKVGGRGTFNNALFDGPVNLSYTDFAWLDVSGTSWPKDPGKFHVEGMSYKTILADPKDESKSHKALIQLADQAYYSANVYSRLEDSFLRQGYRADGDGAFIAGKVRERKEYLSRGDWVGWLKSWMLYLLVGYGRQPWRAIIPCAVVIALGCILFSPNKMEPQRPEDTPRVYSRFWYSFNLFLPVVDLQAGKVWKPKNDQTFLRNYMRVHILLGWILIPLVLAAVTGLIK